MATTDAGVHSEACRRPLRRRSASVASPTTELCALEFWRALIGECLGTFVLVFLSCGAHVSWPLHSVTTLTKSFCAGFAVATASHATSGAHANPALTLAAVVAGKMSPLRATLYVAAQCGGAVSAAALLYGVTSPSPSSLLGCTLVDPSLSPWQATALEAVLTCVLGLTLFAASERPPTGSDAFAIGIAYLAASIVALPATGASMNPARSLGPAFVMNIWTHHWVYWCGPSMGGVVAGLIYEYIFDSPDDNNKKLLVKKDNSDKEVRDDSKSGAARLNFRATESCSVMPPPQPRRDSHHQTAAAAVLQCEHQQQAASHYSTMSQGMPPYRTTRSSSDYSATSRQQFKF